MIETVTRLLYIDDDPALRRLVQRMLGRTGFAVTLAADGAQGLELAAREHFDLIAVDHHMPRMDGLSVLEALRARPGCPPVVYVTGADDGRLAAAALRAGADDYVVKSAGEDFLQLLSTTFAQTLERVQLRRARDEVEQRLRASNERLAALLQEVNHRVANNLQMAISFIGMQASVLPEGAARDALVATQRRIGAIAQVNRHLYVTGEIERVDMRDYLDRLAQDLTETWSGRDGLRTIAVDADALDLPTDRAVTLGIIVCELVGNACKYAYPADAPGEVRIRLLRTGEARIVLAVEDDGAGLNQGDAPQGTGLGQRLVRAMARGLGAEMTMNGCGRGLTVRLEFPQG